jgi:tetratricopeptide (TPR) repeat protein
MIGILPITTMRSKLYGVLALFLFTVACNSSKTTTELAIPDLFPRTGESTPSAEFQKAEATIVKLRAAQREHPERVQIYTELAQIYMQEARITGKHHEYMPIVDRLLEAALARDPNNFDALVLTASNLMTYHKFAEAKELAEKAIEKNGYSSYAYGVLCDAKVELGDYTGAVEASDKMISVRPDLRSYARASYLREIHGDREGAIEAMKMAADAGQFGQENRAWALYNLGNIFLNMGKLDTAQFIFNGILEERPNYTYAMHGLALAKAAKGEYPAAIELLVKASQLAPEHVLIETLADVYLAMGHKELARPMEEKAVESFMQHEQGGWNIDREYAMFCANHDIHLGNALIRAERDLARRPENIDALDTYAWTLLKNGKAKEALPSIEKAMRLKTENASIHYHAAIILNATGDIARAEQEFRQTLALNPYPNPMIAARARNFAGTAKSSHASLNLSSN